MRNLWFSLCSLGIFGLLALFIYRPVLVRPNEPTKVSSSQDIPVPTDRFQDPKRVLKICSDLWMIYTGEAGSKYVGYFIDIMRQLSQPIGYRIEYSVMSWSNCMEQVRGDFLTESWQRSLRKRPI